MISNFHTHTCLCHHAAGEPADYVAQAAKDGCSALGFSDHCPYPVSAGDCWPDCRMDISDAAGYIAAVRDAAKTAPFPVYAGFECEWDSSLVSWYRDELLGTYGADYLALGSHWVTQGREHIYICGATDPRQFRMYIEQTIKGLESGLYAFLAHPDIFMAACKEWNCTVQSYCDALLEAAAALDIPLEINGFGMIKRPLSTRRGMRFQYPYEEFWERAAARGVRVICNSDAHAPDRVIVNAQKARDFAARFGIVPAESIFS